MGVLGRCAKQFVLVLLICFVGISGCATPVKNKREARLMPEDVAKSILSKYLGSYWVSNPVGQTMMVIGCSGNYPMQFSDINRVQVSLNRSQLMVSKWNWVYYPCGNHIHFFASQIKPLSDDEINDVVDALVSLGANIPENSAEIVK